MAGDRQDDPLSALRWHWGDAYIVCHPGPDTWIAQRRDDRDVIRAATPEGYGMRSSRITPRGR